MFDRDSLTAYLRSCSDADLRAAAVRVRLWQLRMYDEPSAIRGLLARVLAAVHEEFGRRGWNIPRGTSSQNFQSSSPWGKVHAEVTRTIGHIYPCNRGAEQVPGEVAEWLGQMPSEGYRVRDAV